MKGSNQFLLVAGVVEGRNFPSRPHHKIVVEAKFGGEILITDEVDHTVNPEFHQELAWEMDKKSMHEHRIQRSIIKVQVFAIDTRTSVRELIGYNVIDLHMAHSSKPNIKWFPMLHCRYQKAKPEVKIGIYREDQPDIATSISRHVTSPGIFKDLKPIWHTDNGDYYQLGPADKCTTNFCLSITISSAAQLANLVSQQQLDHYFDSSRKFFFLYNLLGCNISTEYFTKLSEANFLPERTSVRIRSSIDALRQYFSKQDPFKVSLYCVDEPIPLGACHLSMTELLPSNVHELESRPVVVDRLYRLVPEKELPENTRQISNDLLPVVGMILSFKVEGFTSSRVASASPILKKSTNSPLKDDSLIRQAKSDPNSSGHDGATPNLSASASLSRKQNNLCHFELSVELGSVTLAEGAQPLSNVTLCCSCGLFLTSEGHPTSLTTQPPVELITSGCPVPLAFSRFVVEFASRADRIATVLNKHEVKLQLWSHPKDSQNPVLAAVGLLPLSRLAETCDIVVLGKEGKKIEQRCITESVRLILAGELSTGGQIAATATTSIALRNLGSAADDCVASPVKSQTLRSKSREKPTLVKQRHAKGRLAHGHNTSSKHSNKKPGIDSSKVEAALELELWKDAQEKLFEKQLKTREIEHMKEMAEEWHKRDQQRQLLLTKKMEEYGRLENELRSRLADVERREVELRVGERDVEHLRSELCRYKEMRNADVREAAKRMEDEAHHRISLEKLRVNQLDEELARTKIVLQDAEEKNRRLERDFAAFKQQQRLAGNPDSELLHRVNVLTLDKEELERRVESLQKAKLHYKQQWGHALREVASLRQEQTDISRQMVEKQQRDLEQMRLKYLADEEKKLLSNDFEELRRFREEVNQIGSAALPSAAARTTSPAMLSAVANERVPPFTLAGKGPDICSSSASGGETSSNIVTDSDYITRLIEERDTLLRTGVYAPDDRIIVNLEKKINASLAARSEANRNRLPSEIN